MSALVGDEEAWPRVSFNFKIQNFEDFGLTTSLSFLEPFLRSPSSFFKKGSGDFFHFVCFFYVPLKPDLVEGA